MGLYPGIQTIILFTTVYFITTLKSILQCRECEVMFTIQMWRTGCQDTHSCSWRGYTALEVHFSGDTAQQHFVLYLNLLYKRVEFTENFRGVRAKLEYRGSRVWSTNCSVRFMSGRFIIKLGIASDSQFVNQCKVNRDYKVSFIMFRFGDSERSISGSMAGGIYGVSN